MSTQKHRALQALADAKGRPFLAAAPLMAIVEAVAVLDDAGLLGRESDATLRSDIRAAIDNDEYDDNGALCPKCSEPLFSDGTCMNFPACPNAILPF